MFKDHLATIISRTDLNQFQMAEMMSEIFDGKTSMVTADGQTIFKGIKSPFQAMRYHSLAVEQHSLPDCLTVTATAEDGEIMGLRHLTHITEGIQFHPESIMTPLGKRMLRNFLKMI